MSDWFLNSGLSCFISSWVNFFHFSLDLFYNDRIELIKMVIFILLLYVTNSSIIYGWYEK